MLLYLSFTYTICSSNSRRTKKMQRSVGKSLIGPSLGPWESQGLSFRYSRLDYSFLRYIYFACRGSALTHQRQPLHEVPNSEETASHFSILTFSYLDRVIMMAYRIPHLGLDQLPHLLKEDTSSFLTAKAFPVRIIRSLTSLITYSACSS